MQTEETIILPKSEYLALLDHVSKLELRLKELELLLKELELRLGKNSGNSSKPPSSDGYKKVIHNNREKSGKLPGSQKGHSGKTLEQVSTPDKVIFHGLDGLCECGENLAHLSGEIQVRQVFELPEKLVEVTEHQVEVKRCTCGLLHKAPCPINWRVQYKTKGVCYLFKSVSIHTL